jgi:hypothetical protein
MILLAIMLSQYNTSLEAQDVDQKTHIDVKYLSEIEKSIFTYRDLIFSYDMTLSFELNLFESKIEIDSKVRMVESSGKLLSEHIISKHGIRNIVCQNGEASGYTFRFKQPSDHTKGYGEYTKNQFTTDDCFIDIKMIGLGYGRLTPSVVSRKYARKDYFGDLFTNPISARFVNLNQHKCLEISRKLADQNATDTIWIDLERGPSVVKRERSAKDYRSRFETELQYHEPSKIWFPKRRISERYESGELAEREIATITIHSLNEPIDSNIFSTSKMNLPQGSLIMSHPLNRGVEMIVTEDSSIVPTDMRSTAEPEPKEPSKWWGRVAVAACVLTLIFGFIYLRQRRLKAKSS